MASNLQTSTAISRAGLPVLNAKKFGELHLDQAPIGPDGKKMVASVNGQPIHLDRFMAALKKATGPISKIDPDRAKAIMAALAAPVLDDLISNLLNQQFAKQHNLNVTEEDVNKEIGKENAKRGAGHKLQDEAFAVGQSEAELRDDLRERLFNAKVDEYFDDHFTTGVPTDEQLHHFLLKSGVPTTPTTELRASHIVFRAAPDMKPEQIQDAQARAERILVQLRKGLDWITAVRQNSEDRHTLAKAGDLGYFTRGMMIPEFEKAAFALQPGQISGIVRTPVGFHIIKVTERYEDNSHGLYYRTERSLALEQFHRQLREKAKIERFI